jgi:MFS family permease
MLESPRLAARELWLAAAGAVALALVMHWPLPLHLTDHVARDLGDPIVQAWQVAWGGHALAHQPLHYFQSNQFWPIHDTLAFSDALVGYAPSGLIGNGVAAAIARYNALFLFAYALAFMGAYLLARELGLKPWAAAVAGAAFAYAPWRLEQDGHLHVLSSGGIPLSLFLLLRGYRGSRAGMVLAGWLVAAWQVSLGFTLGLQLGYLIALLAVGVIIWWLRSGKRWRPARSVLVATLAGGGLALVLAVGLSLPYQRVLNNHPEAHRSIERLSVGSGPIWQFLSAPEHNMVWGEATRSIREDHLTSIAEQTLFPGVVIFGLALVGLAANALPKRLRIGLGVAALLLALLSLGFHTSGLGRFYPYRLLYELAPGWQGIRVPGRLNTLTSLALAMLAAAGAQAVCSGLSRRAGGSQRVAIALAAAIVVLICVEGSGFSLSPASGGVLAGPLNPRTPIAPSDQQGIPAPQLHLPINIAANRRYVLWSADGFPKIVNGRASVDPTSFTKLTEEVHDFPDAASVARLRELGVRSVVLHPYLLTGTSWHDAATKSIDGLGVTRTRRGDLVVIDLN